MADAALISDDDALLLMAGRCAVAAAVGAELRRAASLMASRRANAGRRALRRHEGREKDRTATGKLVRQELYLI
jgi:hypothetical protein